MIFILYAAAIDNYDPENGYANGVNTFPNDPTLFIKMKSISPELRNRLANFF